MQIVIQIPEERYKEIVESNKPVFIYRSDVAKVLANGIQLPNRKLLILSEDAVKSEYTSLGFSCQSWISDVGLSNATLTIIEADKAESEDK